MTSSTVFKWNMEEFDQMLASCKNDEAVALTLSYLKSKDDKVLEAGCGSGRVVKYLYDLGYKQVEGIEIEPEVVKQCNKQFRELKIIQGDILKMPYKANTFDMVVSYGVVEHFSDHGLQPPLLALKRVVKKGGVVIVTVPSLNTIRRLVWYVDQLVDWLHPLRNPWVRKLVGLKPWKKRNVSRFGFYVHPQFGEFFEFRLTPEQFERECIKAGFEIIESAPILHLDGMYHIFGKPWIDFSDWQFHPTRPARVVNNLLKKIPFLHNHMHACVLRKV